MWWGCAAALTRPLAGDTGRTKSAAPTTREARPPPHRELLLAVVRGGDGLLDATGQAVDQLSRLLELLESVLADPGGDVGNGVRRGVERGAGAHDVGDGLPDELFELLASSTTCSRRTRTASSALQRSPRWATIWPATG
jgi:hypothetical protein